MSSRVVHVAVGVIIGEEDKILIAKRADEVHQGGLWEFPGGKVEQGETVVEALRRELLEELNIIVSATQPLIQIRHDYGDKVVFLDVHKITQFSRKPVGNEGQPILWVAADEMSNYEFPAANRPIITAIKLPQQYLITGDAADVDEFFLRVEKALQKGIRLVQLRVRDAAILPLLIESLLTLCKAYSAQLQINTSPELFASIAAQKAGLHLNSKNLLACSSRPVANQILLSASCHNAAEIAHAQKIGVDFICLSPVLETSSHPQQTTLQWQAFADLVAESKVPVFALGGMKQEHLPRAIAAGAQGIAGISEWWSEN